MHINEFNDDYLNDLLDKLSKELRDFNINLLNYNVHPRTNEFLDSLSSHYFLLHILQPSRVTTISKTLILIWMGSIGVCFEVGGRGVGGRVKLPPV